MARRKPSIINEIMNEPIRLPGAPQVIVTRGWAYSWLKRLGYNTDPKAGFASVDYMVFGGTRMRPVDEPLTDLTQPHIVELIALMERHATEAA
jgi:hypothetical protein